MQYCLSSSLFDGMESYMRSASGQLDSPSADFTLQATQLHAQCVEQFEGQSLTQPVSHCSSQAAHSETAAPCPAITGLLFHPPASPDWNCCVSAMHSLCVLCCVVLCCVVLCWLVVPASLERYLLCEGSSVASFVALCDTLVAAGDDGMGVFLSLLTTLTDFEAWVSMARDEAKRIYVKRIIATYAAMAATTC